MGLVPRSLHRCLACACAGLLGVAALAAAKPAPRPAAKPASTPRRSPPPVTKLPTVQMYGHEFIDLALWARTNSLRLEWDRQSKEVRLTNRSMRLAGAVSSRQFEIKGVRAWLSVPLTQRDQNLYVTTLDVRSLLDPILRPARNRPGQTVRVIALDPGHGGKDAGNEVGQRQEKTHTLMLARKLKPLLEEAGLRVVLTRNDDTYVDLDERVAIAKRRRADLFVSLHYNSTASGRGDAKGAELYCTTPAGVPSTNARPDEPSSTKAVLGNLANAKNVLLAFQLQKAIVSSLGVEDRGIKRARFVVLRDNEIPAALVEGGFMSEPDEARKIVDAGYRNDLARAIVDGILAYKRLVERK